MSPSTGPRSRATVPTLSALTASTAVFRLHGRNFEGHLKQLQGKAPTVAEKYDYLYREKELEDIARAAGSMNGKAERVHVAMNNNNRDCPVIPRPRVCPANSTVRGHVSCWRPVCSHRGC
jgi:uncharacterized protein YecE (DUF72 family)